MLRRWFSSKPTAWIFVSYLVLAGIQAWPLPLHLRTHVTGPVGGDTGVYVWNTWAFRHELLEQRSSPFATKTIFALDREADLSLHNYTIFADVVSLPLQPILGVVGAFNVVYLFNVALAGFGMYLLAYRVTCRRPESWVAGLLFAWSPFLAARATAHFSLVAAAPLPIFVYWLDRAWSSMRTRDAIAAGLTAAWAAFCDPYYLVYCAMLSVAYIGARAIGLAPRRTQPLTLRHAPTMLDTAFAAVAALVVVVHFISGGTLKIASIQISMRSLYTPVLLLSLIAVLRLLLFLRPRFVRRPLPPLQPMLRLGAAAAISAAILLAPTIYAVGRRMVEGRMVEAPVLWRSSAPGLDLLAYLLPNPNHPLMPAALSTALASRPGGFVEQVGSLSLVGLGVILVAMLRASFRPNKFWLAVTAGFAAISLGPFVQVFGINTYVPTPWTFLRYLPIVGAARMPPRFAVVAFMGFAVIVAAALGALAARYPQHRRRMLAGVAALAAFELLPSPRVLYSAEPPGVYRTIAADPRDVRVLELPFGLRDGLSSLGDVSASSQLYQTYHGKDLIGGYLSRVSERRKNFYLRDPFFRALIVLSEGRSIADADRSAARRSARFFLRRARLGYVVIQRSRTSLALRDFVVDVLRLKPIVTVGDQELYLAPEVRQGAARKRLLPGSGATRRLP
jgi:hypothetical protein